MSSEARAVVKASSRRALRAVRSLTCTQMHFLQSTPLGDSGQGTNMYMTYF